MDRKKELKEAYKNMKFDMGVFMLKCNATGKVYLGADKNVKATLNGILFQLNMGSYLPNRRLEKDWKEWGEQGFTIEILELLKYEEDESKTDYSEELAILKEIWRDKFEIVEDIKK